MRGSSKIKNQTVSMCVASTGRRWPDLLRELSKIQIAGGLHERCDFFCFDVNSDTNSTQLTPFAEKQFYANMYDDLLSSSSVENKLNYSLTQIFFIIKLFGSRTFIWSREAFSFIQPRLNELKTNKPCQLIRNTTIFQTKQHMAIRRRSAEHVVRYACLIQMFLNSLFVLKSMNDNIIKDNNGGLNEAFEIEAKHKIKNAFGTALAREEAFHQNGVPIDPLEIFEDAPILPPNCHLTSYDAQFIRKPQYESIINQKNNDDSNTSDADVNVDIDTDTNAASNQPLLNCLAGSNGNNDDEHEQPIYEFNSIMQNSSIIDLVQSNRSRTNAHHDLGKINDIDTNSNNSHTQYLSSSTSTGIYLFTILDSRLSNS
ncbi:unnamed protein product [Didymodactylos carnosus]|uniref:Uncharacterized protein n=1 Tax=Didymodactylos carnosus TaxID=1234261 RepID=A0A815VG88_9BILA|nr:unnamed protein product [Didymodactylos carnosus]CAF1532528.1 unnamed protein product [Didymodactylos carnosus]CAF4201657.1 unnamed protein product [Didymodactylos carnosus]CAF4391960.1 unnamed protein product [Didymodactylos carnosus]